MRLGWATDLHFDRAKPHARQVFYAEIRAAKVDALLLTGDSATGPLLESTLREIHEHTQVRVWFVAGNHDYYESSWMAQHGVLRLFHREAPLVLMPDGTPVRAYEWLSMADVPLSPTAMLIGTEGWADGRYADWMKSPIDLHDFYRITELQRDPGKRWKDAQGRVHVAPGANWEAVLERQRSFADRGARDILARGTRALASVETLYVATHVPPFPQNAVYDGRLSDVQWLPHFSNKAMGDALLSLADAHPTKQIVALCGHSHGSADTHPRPNLRCITGYAVYKTPALAGVIEVA